MRTCVPSLEPHKWMLAYNPSLQKADLGCTIGGHPGLQESLETDGKRGNPTLLPGLWLTCRSPFQPGDPQDSAQFKWRKAEWYSSPKGPTRRNSLAAHRECPLGAGQLGMSYPRILPRIPGLDTKRRGWQPLATPQENIFAVKTLAKRISHFKACGPS